MSARGVSAKGVSVMEGCLPSACWDTPTPMNRITDACENITLPQLLLRTIITLVSVVIAVEARPPPPPTKARKEAKSQYDGNQWYVSLNVTVLKMRWPVNRGTRNLTLYFNTVWGSHQFTLPYSRQLWNVFDFACDVIQCEWIFKYCNRPISTYLLTIP